jgi:uncharacterized membrane protein YraQ (UPF0718 family)
MEFCKTPFLYILAMVIVAVVGGLIVNYVIKKREKMKIKRMLINDSALNFQNLDDNIISTGGGMLIYKGLNFNPAFKNIPQYHFSISTLKLFEVEGVNIIKHLNETQSRNFLKIINLLHDLENARIFLANADPNDLDYKYFQEMFVDFSKKARDLYGDLVDDIQTWKV